jgi:hypothetical protein
VEEELFFHRWIQVWNLCSEKIKDFPQIALIVVVLLRIRDIAAIVVAS